MICPPCRRGGELNAHANGVTDEEAAGWMRARALESHGECWWATCSCEHKAGQWRNERRDG